MSDTGGPITGGVVRGYWAESDGIRVTIEGYPSWLVLGSAPKIRKMVECILDDLKLIVEEEASPPDSETPAQEPA